MGRGVAAGQIGAESWSLPRQPPRDDPGSPTMRRPRFTIARGMVYVAVAAALLGVFRLGSFAGLVALLPFGITAFVARWESSKSRYRPVLCAGVIGTLLLPFLVAVWINQQMWGYFVSRPAVDRRIVEARQIETLTRVDTRSDSRGGRTIWGLPIGEVDSYIQEHPQEGDYYVLEGRVLRALRDRQALPPEGRIMAAGRLAALYPALEATGRLEEGERGYPDARTLSGIAVEAVGRDGRPLLFVGARGGEVSNDHHPYYEFLFTTDPTGGVLRLLFYQRFYYDVAGVEGAEWPLFFTFLAIFGLIPTLPIQGFILWRGRRRSVRKHLSTASASTGEPVSTVPVAVSDDP